MKISLLFIIVHVFKGFIFYNFLITFYFSKEDRIGSESRNRGLRTTEVGFGSVSYARVDRLLLLSHQRHQIHWQGSGSFRITQYYNRNLSGFNGVRS